MAQPHAGILTNVARFNPASERVIFPEDLSSQALEPIAGLRYELITRIWITRLQSIDALLDLGGIGIKHEIPQSLNELSTSTAGLNWISPWYLFSARFTKEFPESAELHLIPGYSRHIKNHYLSN
jgi:hypothetical protein